MRARARGTNERDDAQRIGASEQLQGRRWQQYRSLCCDAAWELCTPRLNEWLAGRVHTLTSAGDAPF